MCKKRLKTACIFILFFCIFDEAIVILTSQLVFCLGKAACCSAQKLIQNYGRHFFTPDIPVTCFNYGIYYMVKT